MLPVTHGEEYTRLQILLYTIILVAVTLMPFALRMSGFIYLGSAMLLNAVFMWYALSLYRNYTDTLARSMFKFSILYLTLLFAALLVDHYWMFKL